MLKLTPVSSAIAALIIASALSGCGGGNVEPVSAMVGSNAQTTAVAAAEAAKAAEVVAAAADAKAAAKAKAAAAAKAKAAAAAKTAAAVVQPAPAPKPAPVPAPSAKEYANCTAMHVDYKGGVARPGAVDQRASGHAQYTPVYSTSLYNANTGSDRDKDGIACEA